MYAPIKEFIDNYYELKNYLIGNGQISLENNIENHLKKVMLLSCASYYENEIQRIIKEFIDRNSKDEKVKSFAYNKAIARQYHTYFKWDGKNINNFLGLFGEEFKKEISNKITQDEELNMQMRAFLEIGNERNKMVHENFMVYQLDKTFDEIIILNEAAERFIDFLNEQFK